MSCVREEFVFRAFVHFLWQLRFTLKSVTFEKTIVDPQKSISRWQLTSLMMIRRLIFIIIFPSFLNFFLILSLRYLSILHFYFNFFSPSGKWVEESSLIFLKFWCNTFSWLLCGRRRFEQSFNFCQKKCCIDVLWRLLTSHVHPSEHYLFHYTS